MRSQIDADHVYKSDVSALIAFSYFLNLRNKNIIHDENALSQAIPEAAVNDGTKSFKIEKIIVTSLDAITLGQENINNLSLLIERTLTWIEKNLMIM